MRTLIHTLDRGMRFFVVLSALLFALTGGFSHISASEPGYWRQTRVDAEPPNFRIGPQPPDYQFQFTSDGPGACVSEASFRDSTRLKVRFSWDGPPGSLTPGEVIPITFKLDVLEARIGPGGFGASLDARVAGQGWSFLETPDGGNEVNNGQAAGTSRRRSNTRNKAPVGAPGQKFTYEVFATASNTNWVYRYVYEWVSGTPPAAPVSDLSGTWSCSDGGTYVIRQNGGTIEWEGRSADGGATWSHHFTGTLSRDLIQGHFKDSPSGRIHGEGDLVVRVVDPTHLEFVSCTVGFGGRHWTRK